MADYLPKFDAAKAFTLTASATVTGGRLVVPSGAQTIAHSIDDSQNVVGVAGFDAVSGDSVTVYPRRGVHRLTASGAIAPGARIAADVNGKVQTIGANINPIGTALEAAAADGDVIDVVLD